MTGRCRQILILVSWMFLLISQAQAAEQPVLVFPQIAAGTAIRLEINLANLGNQVATGYIWFREDDGDSMGLLVEGDQTAKVSFSLPPGGARKFSASSDSTKVGYAVVMSSSKSVVGSLIYTINGQYDVSVPHSPATTQAHVVVDESKQFDSAVAFLNTGSEQTTLRLSLRCEQGTEIAKGTLELPGGQKVARFVQDPDLLRGVPGQLTGVLNITADKPFHLLGLRQRQNGALASLAAGTGTFLTGGSQIIYLIDSGVDLTSRGFSQEQLAGKTVYELTGISKSVRSQKVVLRNTNLERAVTLKCYFLNDKGREFLSFLIVLKCGQTLIFDPFDFEIPGTGGLRTSQFVFGTLEDIHQGGAERWTAAGFGSGRFLFSAGAVGAPLSGGDTAYFLYPNEIAPIGECGVTPALPTGAAPGISSQNLHICNALPMAFDYLTADRPESEEERNEAVQADAQWMALTAFTRTMSTVAGIALTCQAPAVPDDPAKVFEAFEALNEQSDEAEDGWPTALVIYNGAETYKLSK